MCCGCSPKRTKNKKQTNKQKNHTSSGVRHPRLKFCVYHKSCDLDSSFLIVPHFVLLYCDDSSGCHLMAHLRFKWSFMYKAEEHSLGWLAHSFLCLHPFLNSTTLECRVCFIGSWGWGSQPSRVEPWREGAWVAKIPWSEVVLPALGTGLQIPFTGETNKLQICLSTIPFWLSCHLYQNLILFNT